MSEWQTPQNRISIRTSSGPGERRSIVNGASGDWGEVTAHAAVFSVPPVERDLGLETVVVIGNLLRARVRNGHLE
jgi:hypothetical protein